MTYRGQGQAPIDHYLILTLLMAATIAAIVVPEKIIAIAQDPKAWLLSSPKKEQAAKVTQDLSVKGLFATPKSLGSLAICAAEGNCTPQGKPLGNYKGHGDPGDGNHNKGYCSSSAGRRGYRGKFDVNKANQFCTEENTNDEKYVAAIFQKAGVDPSQHLLAYISAVDFGNQARDSHAKAFAKAYVDQVQKGKTKFSADEVGTLRTQVSYKKLGGLHRACRNWSNSTKRRVGVSNIRSDREKFKCVKYDQQRRVDAIASVLNTQTTPTEQPTVTQPTTSERSAATARSFAFPVLGGGKECPQITSIGYQQGDPSGCVARKLAEHHMGWDIVGPHGTIIVAAESGTVAEVGWDDFGLGKYVKIKHPDGLSTVYGHNSELLVRKGQQIGKGKPIAKMGKTGSAPGGTHLHFEVHKTKPDGDWDWDDPGKYLQTR